MNTNVNLAAPLGAMAFLGTGFVLVVTGLALIYSLAVRKFGLAKIVTIAMLVIAVLLGMVTAGIESLIIVPLIPVIVLAISAMVSAREESDRTDRV